MTAGGKVSGVWRYRWFLVYVERGQPNRKTWRSPGRVFGIHQARSYNSRDGPPQPVH